MAIQNGWHNLHFAFQNAFPNGKLGRPVFIESLKHVPFPGKTTSKALKLQRSLYDIKDAARIWFETVSHNFKSFNWHEIKAVLYVSHDKGMILICYVDDLLIFAENANDIYERKEMFKNTLP